MVVAIVGIIFGILGIYSIGVVFVPLAALCALFAFISGVIRLQFSTAFLGLVAAALSVAGWFASPSLWLLTAATFAIHSMPMRPSIPPAQPSFIPVVPTPPEAMPPAANPLPTTAPPSSDWAYPLSNRPPVDTGRSSAFQDGLRDRTSAENWVTMLPASEREGAVFWSTQRSLPYPAPCTSLSFDPNAPQVRGCHEAQVILAPSDVRRKGEPDYRQGWNAYRPQ
jgi:hypothetical protein